MTWGSIRKRSQLQFVVTSSGAKKPALQPAAQEEGPHVFLRAIALLTAEPSHTASLKKIQEYVRNFLAYHKRSTKEMAEEVAKIVPQLLSLPTIFHCEIHAEIPIPAALRVLTNLRDLTLHTFVDKEQIGEFTQIKNLFWTGLQIMPAKIGSCTALELLALGIGKLFHLPSEIGLLRRLTELSVMENQLVDLPQEIENCQHLTTLNLRMNRIKMFPTVIQRLTALRELMLQGNQLHEVPATFKHFHSLEVLDFSQNNLRSFPPLRCTALTSLNLRANCELSVVVSAISLLTALRFLNVSKIGLAGLPREITALQHLEMLDLSHNHMTALPLEICRLPRLESLNVEGNPLQVLKQK